MGKVKGMLKMTVVAEARQSTRSASLAGGASWSSMYDTVISLCLVREMHVFNVITMSTMVIIDNSTCCERTAIFSPWFQANV